MKRIILKCAVATALIAPNFSARGADAVDFDRDIKPILEISCVKCHGEEKPKGGLQITTRAKAIKGGDSGTVLVPGDALKSPLYTSTILPPDDEKAMPPKGDRLPKADTDKLKTWIEQGAVWPEGPAVIL